MTKNLSSLQKKFALRQSGDLDRKSNHDVRPMTLRRRVSPVLPFGSRSALTSEKPPLVLDALTLRRRLLTVLLLSAALTLMAQFSFRVGLCVTGFSRYCSFSEHFYYCIF